MAGRPVSRALAEAAAKRIAEAHKLPTDPRSKPVSYSPELCDEVIALGRVGLDDTEIADHWNISAEQFREMEEAHAAFADAASRARTSCKAWWIRQMRIALAAGDTKFPAGSWAQGMRRWRDFGEDRIVGVDLSKLVIIDLSDAHSPRERMTRTPKALPDNETVRLSDSQTAEGSVESERLGLDETG